MDKPEDGTSMKQALKDKLLALRQDPDKTWWSVMLPLGETDDQD